jgi:hypothetical protein
VRDVQRRLYVYGASGPSIRALRYGAQRPSGSGACHWVGTEVFDAITSDMLRVRVENSANSGVEDSGVPSLKHCLVEWAAKEVCA